MVFFPLLSAGREILFQTEKFIYAANENGEIIVFRLVSPPRRPSGSRSPRSNQTESRTTQTTRRTPKTPRRKTPTLPRLSNQRHASGPSRPNFADVQYNRVFNESDRAASRAARTARYESRVSSKQPSTQQSQAATPQYLPQAMMMPKVRVVLHHIKQPVSQTITIGKFRKKINNYIDYCLMFYRHVFLQIFSIYASR